MWSRNTEDKHTIQIYRKIAIFVEHSNIFEKIIIKIAVAIDWTGRGKEYTRWIKKPFFSPDMVSLHRVQFFRRAAYGPGVIHIVGVGEGEDLRSHPPARFAFRRLAQFLLPPILRQLFRCSIALNHLVLHINGPAVVFRLGKGHAD